MSKGNRVGGPTDFNYYGLAQSKPSSNIQMSRFGYKLCGKCRLRKSTINGRGGFGRPFICAGCRVKK